MKKGIKIAPLQCVNKWAAKRVADWNGHKKTVMVSIPAQTVKVVKGELIVPNGDKKVAEAKNDIVAFLEGNKGMNLRTSKKKSGEVVLRDIRITGTRKGYLVENVKFGTNDKVVELDADFAHCTFKNVKVMPGLSLKGATFVGCKGDKELKAAYSRRHVGNTTSSIEDVPMAA